MDANLKINEIASLNFQRVNGSRQSSLLAVVLLPADKQAAQFRRYNTLGY